MANPPPVPNQNAPQVPSPNDKSAAIDALAQKVTQPGGTAGTLSFIGLPSTATDLSGSLAKIQPGQQAPRYYEGAQYLPVMLNSSPQDIATLQGQMVTAGL